MRLNCKGNVLQDNELNWNAYLDYVMILPIYYQVRYMRLATGGSHTAHKEPISICLKLKVPKCISQCWYTHTWVIRICVHRMERQASTICADDWLDDKTNL